MRKTKEEAIQALGRWRSVEGNRDSLRVIDRTKEHIEKGTDFDEMIEEIELGFRHTTDTQTRNALLFSKAIIENLQQ